MRVKRKTAVFFVIFSIFLVLFIYRNREFLKNRKGLLNGKKMIVVSKFLVLTFVKLCFIIEKSCETGNYHESNKQILGGLVMKKTYYSPHIQAFVLDVANIVATSSVEEAVFGDSWNDVTEGMF